MADIRPAITRWQQRISASTGLALAVLAGLVIVTFALGIAGGGIRNTLVHSALAATAGGGAGMARVVAFGLMLAPGMALTLSCAVFVSRFRTSVFVAVVASLALVVLAGGAAFPLRDRNEPPVQPLTGILVGQGASAPVATAVTDALWFGLLALVILAVGALCWSLALVYARPPAATTTGVLRVYSWIALSFRWAYPVALVVAIPVVVLNFAWNTA